MAVLNGCSLCKPAEYIKNKLEENKKEFLTYSIFLILLIEWGSFIYLNWFHGITKATTDFYDAKVYPFATNLALFIILFSVFLWHDRLRFCFRKSATTFYLSVYYLFNCVAVLTCFNASYYYQIVSLGLLGISTFLFIVSLLNSRK